MVARKERESHRTTVQKQSDREVVVTRTFDAPARLVFEAWSRPELFRKWWVPRSMGVTLRSCEMDVRTGGKYRLVFGDDPAGAMAFFGKYLDVVPDKRIVWTNEESGDAGSVTTVTFEERDGQTLLVLRELYPTKEALEAAGTGAQEVMNETFGQLDELLAGLSAR
ncbi:MAG TPA: SRPBCC family protein [Rhodanobacteraceae bacterium]|nr:SRPBCC family protein [Rhodanobacteraceae bacterium]